MTTLVLIAKEPLAGQTKTRLSPPLSLEQAAELAAACIDDTVATIRAIAANRVVLFFEGLRTPASASDFDVIRQPSGSLDERLAYLFDTIDGPTILIGMDTPQLTTLDLAPAFEPWPAEIDAWFGPATDGGFWAIGMQEPRGELIRGVPMSRDDTGAIQLDRLVSAGLNVGRLGQLTDVDTIVDARSVAQGAPDTRFARMLNSFEPAGAAARAAAPAKSPGA